MKKALGLAAAIATILPFVPASAGVALPYSKTVRLEYPHAGYYDPETSPGAWLNRCFASGGADCIPHDQDIGAARTTYHSSRGARCLYLADSSLAQSETSSPTSTSGGQSGQIGFVFDLGIDANVVGKYFKLKNVSTGGTLGPADFDIFWIWKLGCSETVQGPTTHPLDSIFSNPGDEQGRIPGYAGNSQCDRDANGSIRPGCPRYALVTMFQGDPGSQFKLTICKTESSTIPTSCPAGS